MIWFMLACWINELMGAVLIVCEKTRKKLKKAGVIGMRNVEKTERSGKISREEQVRGGR